jgi:hypothetical protein
MTADCRAFCPCPGMDRSQSAPTSHMKNAGFIGVNWEELMLLPTMKRLENHCGGNSTGGSNPSPSANNDFAAAHRFHHVRVTTVRRRSVERRARRPAAARNVHHAVYRLRAGFSVNLRRR